MATHIGKEGIVSVGANVVAELNGFTIDSTAEEVEDSELSDEWKTFKSGTDIVKEWSASLECWWDETDTNGQEALTVGASVTLNLYPEGTASTSSYRTGTAFVTAIGMAVTKSGITTRTIGVKGSGALSVATV